MEKIKVYIEADPENVPKYAHETDAGMDVFANESVVIAPGETKLIKTGIKLAIPEGYECQVRPRSGLSLHTPLRICNAPGTIDAGYRDEIGVIMENTSSQMIVWGHKIKILEENSWNHFTLDEKKNRPGWYTINKGDKIAQLVFKKYERADLEIVPDVKAIGEDRGGGFGSTGHR